MKFILLFFNFLFFSAAVSQDFRMSEQEFLVNNEKKSASKLMQFVANQNTNNYDVTSHKIEINVDPAVNAIAGNVTTTFVALANMNEVTFDLSNAMLVSAVVQGTINLTFSQPLGSNELIINLPTLLPQGASETIKITYSGVPTTSGFDSFEASTHGGTPIMWTLSEPFGARDWWPCKQDLNDKISKLDFYITAPAQYVSVANGVEPEAPIIIGSNKTTHFQHNYPIPAYLIAFAVTNYAVIEQEAGTAPNKFPIINYVYPENVGSVLSAELSQTPLIMNLFEKLFETYPFSSEKYGHAQFGWGGGMEHTTVSFMGNFSRSLIAHELAHQWFGDKITCGSWQDIWLNEGFATYCASLVIEEFDGQAAFTNNKTAMINNITFQPGGSVYLSDAEALDVNRIFSSRLSYNKGAMVLNMLRLKMGSTNFFKGIKNYLADQNFAYKYAVTNDFKAKMEEVHGSSLSVFFNNWIYGQGYPTYTITGENFTQGKVRFLVSQTQSHASVPFFQMPLPIRISGTNGQTQDLNLDNTANNQYIIADANFPMTNFVFDPKKDIISKNNNTTFSFKNQELRSLILFPNPSATTVSINAVDGIIIYNTVFVNLLGQQVKETSSTSTWDVSQLSDGIYFLKATTNVGERVFKFIKK